MMGLENEIVGTEVGMSTGTLDIETTITLSNGVRVPMLGLGVFKVEEGEETLNAVRWALEIGYRHIDTAAFYGNEESVGKAIAESGVDPGEVFVTTKCWRTDMGYSQALAAFDESRKRLDRDVVDLYLIHWPSDALQAETWRAFEKLYADGNVRAIGVSNFLVPHLEALARTQEVEPMINQVEFHPFLIRPELVAYQRARGIVPEAWSPLTRGKHLDNAVLADIASHHGKSPAQVLIRWDLQRGVVTIPKSVHRSRIEENADVFDFALDPDEMERINGLDREERLGPDPMEMAKG